MNAEPFVKHGVKFRALIPQERKVPFEASECCLVYSDFRKFGVYQSKCEGMYYMSEVFPFFVIILYYRIIINLTSFLFI